MRLGLKDDVFDGYFVPLGSRVSRERHNLGIADNSVLADQISLIDGVSVLYRYSTDLCKRR